MTALEIIGVLITFIMGSGVLGFYIKYSTRLALAERDAASALIKTEQHTKEIGQLSGQFSHMEATMEDIKKHLAKLDNIEEIRVNVQFMKEKMEDVVPRAEMEAYLKQQEKQVDELKEEVRKLHNKQN